MNDAVGGVRVIWASEWSVRLIPGDAGAVARVHRALRGGVPGVLEATPGAGTVRVSIDRGADPEAVVGRAVRAAEAALGGGGTGADARTVEIPVCYDEAFGPDLGGIADGAGVSREEAAAAHAGSSYRVRFLGFAPGFAYMDGLPDALRSPRLGEPRTRVRAGSVGIAGSRTGIYPFETPGGWRLIGATPLRVFDPGRAEASLLRVGDRVAFRAVSRDEFEALASGGG